MSQEPKQHLTADEAIRNVVAQRIAPLDGLNPVIHQPTRLRLVALLAMNQEAMRFQTLAELLQVQTSLLSMHLTILERAGFIAIRKRRRAGMR